MNTKVEKLNNKEKKIFENYFMQNDEFVFEGCWLRNQRPENAERSGYVDETTQRRRYIHFYSIYNTVQDKGCWLNLKNYYLYVTNTLPKDEIESYLNKILNALNANGFVKNDNIYTKNKMEIIINTYDNHPRNTTRFPKNYTSCDIVIHNEGYDYDALQNRMWRLSTKMYRMPDKRENPTYVKDINQIVDYLPAQIEMGCGPSITAGVPPLYEMHETYKVQNHTTGCFYFAEEDTLILDIINNPEKMYAKFSQTVLKCIRAKLTKGYKTFKKIYKAGLFKGMVYNNNFDRIVKRFNIPETILRVYDLDYYLPKFEADKDVKSLLCIGCHADRRQIQRQARAQGLKVIYIDPEGFYSENGFEPYPIEGPKTGDLIWKTTFEQAMKELNKSIKKLK